MERSRKPGINVFINGKGLQNDFLELAARAPRKLFNFKLHEASNMPDMALAQTGTGYIFKPMISLRESPSLSSSLL